MILSPTPIYAQNRLSEKVRIISFVPPSSNEPTLKPEAIVITSDNKLESIDIRELTIVDSPEQEEAKIREEQQKVYDHLYEQIAFANDDPNIKSRLTFTLRSSFNQGDIDYRDAVIERMRTQVENYKKAKGNKLNDKK